MIQNATFLAFFNGDFINEDQIKISINDRGLLFGDGIFTTIKVADGRIEFWQEHLERLANNCQVLGIVPPDLGYSVLSKLITKNNALQGSFRLKILITGGSREDLDLNKRSYGIYLITLSPYSPSKNFCRLSLHPLPVMRPVGMIKSLAYLDRLWLLNYARQQGNDDIVTVDSNNYILETAFSNLFWKVNHDFYSPDPSLCFLEGITINAVKKMMKKLGFSIQHVKINLNEIPEEAQVYCCNSLKGIQAVEAIGDRNFQRDLSFEKIINDSFEVVKRESC